LRLAWKVWQGASPFWAGVTLHLYLQFFKVGTASMMPHSYISKCEVDYSPLAAQIMNAPESISPD
jgi:hypothetical protein